MKKSAIRISLAFALLSLVGCAAAPRTTMLGPARAAIAVESVRIYQQPPRRFQQIAVVEGRSVDELRTRAAAVGANGIIAGGIVHKPGPDIGIGIGGGGYSWGRHSAVGVESGAAFGIPTGSDVLTATAIYVP